jgi:hypothetical protein
MSSAKCCMMAGTSPRPKASYTLSTGFDVEFGYGGLRIEDATWTVSEITKPSFWGHRPPIAARPATET